MISARRETDTMRRLRTAKNGTKLRLRRWFPQAVWDRDDDRDWTRTVWCLTDVGRKHIPRPRGRR